MIHVFLLTRKIEPQTVDRIYRLLSLPRVEYETEEDAWLAGFEAWPAEVIDRIEDYLDIHDSETLTDNERVYLIYLVFDMMHGHRVTNNTPNWQRLAAIIECNIDLHFPLISNWFHATKSTLTPEGWLSPVELNPHLCKIVDKYRPAFRWDGSRYVRVAPT